LFVVSVAMVVGGLYVVIAQLLWSLKIFFLAVAGGAALAALGLYILWTDFVAPMLGVESDD
jgi:hypothetical protein